VTASPTQLRPGTVFAGDFRIDKPLRAGGMGAVYIATQLSTGTRRAVKLMLPSYAASDSARRRFEQEARIGAHIPSEHVVQVIAAGFDEATGSPWLAMELLEGEELADRIGRAGPLQIPEARVLFTQLGHAMGAAHRARIVHRDLKPENIFLALPRTAGLVPFTVKVLDFGIAKVASEAISQNTGTMGTPIWMAPEQTGPGHEIAPATDVWALGLIAYYALTGRSFWRAASDTHASMQSLLREILIDPIPPLRERAAEQGVLEFLPAGFDLWFTRCVRRETSERFADADEATAALSRVFQSEGGAPDMLRMGADALPDRPAGLDTGRKKVWWIAGAIAAVAVVGGGGALLFGGGTPQQAAQPVADPRSAIAAGSLWWGNLVLPQSTSADEPCDATGFAVALTPKEVLAGDPPKHLFSVGEDRRTGAPAQVKRLGVTDFFLMPLASALNSSPTRRMLVMADAATPYRLLSEVLYTAGQTGITRWDFAVARDGHPRSFSVYPPRSADGKGPQMKIVVQRDWFEAYGGVHGDAGVTWKPLGARCDHESAMVTPMHETAQLEECLATVQRKLGKIVPQVSAPPEVAFGRMLLAVDRIRTGFGDVELAPVELVEPVVEEQAKVGGPLAPNAVGPLGGPLPGGP
jgi:serine/threonine protein kinase